MNNLKCIARINSVNMICSRVTCTTVSTLRRSIRTSCCHFKSKSDDKPNDGISAKDIQNIKRYQWENVNLFGPLRMTEGQRRKYLKENVNENLAEADCSGLMAGGELNREQAKHVKIRQTESGFKENGDGESSVAFRMNDTSFEVYKHKGKKPKLDAKAKIDAENSSERIQKDSRLSIKKLYSQNPNNENPEVSKSTDLPSYLQNFPLCANSGNETFKSSFADYCKEILNIESDFRMSSVTNILQQTMPEASRAALEKWENKMIDKLGLDGFKAYKEEMFAVGRLLHKQIENRLSEQTLEDPADERLKGYWKSVRHVFQHFSDVKLLESKVEHPVLRYKGIIDCVAVYKNVLAIVEWKTSQRPRLSLKDIYDNPIQVAAYAGALNYSQNNNQQINHGIVVIAYSSGNPAHVHYLDQNLMEHYWSLWLKRYEKYIVQNQQLNVDR